MTNKTTVRENPPEGGRTNDGDDSQPDWEALGHELLMALLWERWRAVDSATTSIEQGLRNEELDPQDVKELRSKIRQLYTFVDSDLVRATSGIDHYPGGL